MEDCERDLVDDDARSNRCRLTTTVEYYDDDGRVVEVVEVVVDDQTRKRNWRAEVEAD